MWYNLNLQNIVSCCEDTSFFSRNLLTPLNNITTRKKHLKKYRLRVRLSSLYLLRNRFNLSPVFSMMIKSTPYGQVTFHKSVLAVVRGKARMIYLMAKACFIGLVDLWSTVNRARNDNTTGSFEHSCFCYYSKWFRRSML